VIVAVPVTDEWNVTIHVPVPPVVQPVGLKEPIFDEKETATPDFPSDADAVIVDVDVWAVVMVVGLAETVSEGGGG